MKAFNLKKSVLTMMAATAALASGFSGEASACSKPKYICYQPQVVYTQPVQRAEPVTTIVTRTEVVARVSIAPPVRHLPEVPQGSTMRIKVNFLGNEPGVVFMTAGKLTLQCRILEWAPTHVMFELPEIGVIEASEVTLDVAKANGTVARTVDVLLTPTPDIEIIENVDVIPRAPRKVSGNRPTLETGGIPVVTGG
jgi:hypothetical protein